MTRGNTVEKLKTWITINPESNCWEWRGNQTSTGYGHISYKCKKVKAHRLYMYFYSGFDLKSKDWVKHKCNKKLCVNPDHLYLQKIKHSSS